MKFWVKIKTQVTTEKDIVYSPIKGKVIPLEEIADGVFSEGILGNGCGIKPAEGKIYAPFNGKIIQIADTKHAIGLLSENGIELLIHVGIDTVKMNGTGFKPLVKLGDKVKCGQPLMDFSINEIAVAGFKSVTAIIVTNTTDYEKISVIDFGEKEPSSKLLQVS